MICTH